MKSAMSNAWARQVDASSAWFYSLAWIFLSSPERFLRGSDLDSARQTETCQYEPCVTSRPPFVKQSGSFDQTPCLWSLCSLPLSSSFHLSFFLVFFFFFIFTFLETGKVKTPPPPNGHARILVNAEIYGRSLTSLKLFQLGVFEVFQTSMVFENLVE